MARILASTLMLALAASQVLAGHRSARRSLGTHQILHSPHVDRKEIEPATRHEYIRSNSTLLERSQKRSDTNGRATFYHPATEGGAQSSCGEWMNDYTMGVALSIPGWNHFASQGISNSDLCYKPITIHGPYGEQQAQIMDQCPSDSGTNTCFDICDIDLTYGLFGKLENYDAGIFPVTWSFNDGTPSPCGSSSGSSSSSSSKSSTPSSTSSKSSSKPTSSSSSSKPTSTNHVGGTTSGSYSTSLQWWDSIDSQWCPGVNVPDGVATAAVGPTDKYDDSSLSSTCGKWLTITSNGKTTQAVAVEWVPGSEQNLLAVGTQYNDIINNGDGSITWSWNN